jgi:FkbM family methyltransferase
VDDILDINARGIPMRFSATNGRLRVWATRFEEIEPELLDIIDAMPRGSVFYDVGASIGLFSLYAALRSQGRVFAFEPEAQNYATLELNHFLNRQALAQPLTALNLALSDSAGLGQIHTKSYGAGEHGKILDQAVSQDTKQAFQPAHVQSILKFPLDQIIAQFGFPAPNILKIDVDGAEAAVLRGAAKTLDDPALSVVFIELSKLSATDESRILEGHGFHLAERFPVVRLSGGHYPDLYNCVFRR